MQISVARWEEGAGKERGKERGRNVELEQSPFMDRF